MRLLVVTNLYPPQELGGYGRSIADFVWGLQQRGHQLQVISSDAPHLGPSANTGPSGEAVDRRLQLKGTYQGGVQPLQDAGQRQAVDRANSSLLEHWLQSAPWDGILLGNLDLLGPELLAPLLKAGIPVQHHVGFVSPPYHPAQAPREPHYQLVAASEAVRAGLLGAGLPVAQAPVVYPGARTELFELAMPGPLPADGNRNRPLKLCFAGLLMASKGAHTVVEALIQLQRRGFWVQLSLAGAPFQAQYREQIEALLQQHGLEQQVQWVGQLHRPQLARFLALHHVGVFPSIHPEAFGIVGAEMQASGLVLVTSGVGGAAELVEDGQTGLRFQPGDASSLAACLERLIRNPAWAEKLALAGRERVRQRFSVQQAAAQLEQGFRNPNSSAQADKREPTPVLF
jgi:glycosyltransferase involved in cell wall biosynthesis